jgi:hypothetical protein
MSVASLLMVVALLGANVPPGTVFRWFDKQGNLHVTDTLAEVPEPYYGLYAAKLRERDESSAPGSPVVAPSPAPAPATTPSATGSLIEAEAARRQSWKALVKQWRDELAKATDELAAVDAELDPLRQNPILRETPPVRAQIEGLEKKRSGVMARLEKARAMLLTELPTRAKKEGVPPGWLL